MQFTEYFSKGPWEPFPLAIVVGGNRFAYDTLRMHADVSKVIPKMNCFRDIFGRVIAEFCRMYFVLKKGGCGYSLLPY